MSGRKAAMGGEYRIYTSVFHSGAAGVMWIAPRGATIGESRSKVDDLVGIAGKAYIVARGDVCRLAWQRALGPA
jgi:hypothetical protein